MPLLCVAKGFGRGGDKGGHGLPIFKATKAKFYQQTYNQGLRQLFLMVSWDHYALPPLTVSLNFCSSGSMARGVEIEPLKDTMSAQKNPSGDKD